MVAIATGIEAGTAGFGLSFGLGFGLEFEFGWDSGMFEKDFVIEAGAGADFVLGIARESAHQWMAPDWGCRPDWTTPLVVLGKSWADYTGYHNNCCYTSRARNSKGTMIRTGD